MCNDILILGIVCLEVIKVIMMNYPNLPLFRFCILQAKKHMVRFVLQDL